MVGLSLNACDLLGPTPKSKYTRGPCVAKPSSADPKGRARLKVPQRPLPQWALRELVPNFFSNLSFGWVRGEASVRGKAPTRIRVWAQRWSRVLVNLVTRQHRPLLVAHPPLQNFGLTFRPPASSFNLYRQWREERMSVVLVVGQ
jgi:hypothetical protein